MIVSSLRLLLAATAIFLFVHLCADDVRCQPPTVDRTTQRNGMHTCPVGQFVVGVHMRDNILLCSDSYGNYTRRDEIIDQGDEDGGPTQVEGMHACPPGMAVTGLHMRDNKLACAPVGRATPRIIDAGTVYQFEGVNIHTCPGYHPVSGIHLSRNLLLCGTSGVGNEANEYADSNSMRNEMRSCPGGFIVGVHLQRNVLLCSRAFGETNSAYETVYRTPASFSDMPMCPEGMAMTGLHVRRKWITCARPDAPSTQRLVDRDTQREGMHACPRGRPMAGLDVAGNNLICGTHGTPLRDPRIERLEPAEPVVGETFTIHGYNFDQVADGWVVHLYQPTRGDTQTLQLEIVQRTNESLIVKLPPNIPGSRNLPRGRYMLKLVVPGRLLSSNSVFPTLITRPAQVTRQGEPRIRAIYRDGIREALWIYGDFPSLLTAASIPDRELLIRRPGESTSTPMNILEWRRTRMIADTGLGCDSSGTHLVHFRTGINPVHRSNEMPVMLDDVWCRQTTAGMERRFMQIAGVEFQVNPMSTDRSEYPRPGDQLDIFGTGFGDVWEPELRITEGKRVVELSRGVHGRAQIIEAPVVTTIRDFDSKLSYPMSGRTRKSALQWSDFHILVEIPRDIEPDEYMVSIHDKLANRASNSVTIRIVARESPRR